jgi:SH3-like domain-containing protein
MNSISKLLSLLFAGMLTLSACGSATPAAVAAKLTSPQQQAQFKAGDSVKVEGSVSGGTVKKAQLLINNAAIAIVDQATEAGTYEIVIDYPLPADASGSYVLQLKGLNEKDEPVSESDLVFITVNPASPATAPPPPPTAAPTLPPPPTAAPPAASDTVTSTAADTPAPAAAITGAPSVLNKDNEFVNIRSGPGLTFAIVGQLKQTASAPVKAKSEDGQWWQIEFAGGTGGVAWVNGGVVQFSGDATKLQVVKVAVPTAAPVQPTAAVVALATLAPAAPAAPTTAPAALLPYSQADGFQPRNDIGDVPLGHQGESNASKWTWTINGAQRVELEITAQTAPDSFDCPAGNLAGVAPNTAVGKRVPVNATGEYAFTIAERGYYLFTLHVVKADGSSTTLPRNVIFGCYKKQGR